MRLTDAVPALLDRPLSLVERGTRVVVAGALLDVPHREILKVVSNRKGGVDILPKSGECSVFSGYTVLVGLLQSDPEDYYRFLFEPCEKFTLSVHPLKPDVELTAVLEHFAKTRFGWALVQAPRGYGLVALPDLIALYRDDVFETDLRVRDLATQNRFSLPGGTRLREALQEMMNRRIRRVFLEGNSNSFVSDREILTYLFSPDRLAVARDHPRKVLDATLIDVGAVEAIEVDGKSTVKDVSRLFKPESGAWSVVCDGGVVTPWDLVMRPWEMGHLKIRESPNEKGKQGRSVKPTYTENFVEALKKNGYSVKLDAVIMGKSDVEYRVDFLAESPEGKKILGLKSHGKETAKEIITTYVVAFDTGAEAFYIPFGPLNEESERLAAEYKITVSSQNAPS